MSRVIDIFVIYQEDGLPHEKVLEVPAGLSNTEFMNFVHASIGETANIVNILNIDALNRQKPVPSSDTKGSTARPERRSDSRPSFGATRPYGTSRGGDRPSGGYAGRSPRDGARPPRAGFGSRPSRGDSRESRMGSAKSRAERPASRIR